MVGKHKRLLSRHCSSNRASIELSQIAVDVVVAGVKKVPNITLASSPALGYLDIQTQIHENAAQNHGGIRVPSACCLLANASAGFLCLVLSNST